MALLLNRKNNTYASGYKIKLQVNEITKYAPAWVKFLLELGKEKNRHHFKALHKDDAYKLTKEKDHLVITHRISQDKETTGILEEGNWLVKTVTDKQNYAIYDSDEALLRDYEVLRSIPDDVVYELTQAQVDVISSLLNDTQYESLNLIDGHGAIGHQFKLGHENMCSLQEWIGLLDALTIRQEVNYSTPRIDTQPKEDKPVDYAAIEKEMHKAIRFAKQYGAGPKAINDLLSREATKYKLDLGDLHKLFDKIMDANKDTSGIITGRYVINQTGKVVQAIQMTDACLTKTDDLPEWVKELMAGRIEEREPILVLVKPIEGDAEAQKGYNFLKKMGAIACLLDQNSGHHILKKGTWLVRDVEHYPGKGNVYNFLGYQNHVFEMLFSREKEAKQQDKLKNTPLPWSDPKWLPYTYLDINTNKYVLAFEYNSKFTHTPLSQMPVPIRNMVSRHMVDMVNSPSYPQLTLCLSDGRYYGKLRYDTVRSSRVAFGSILTLELSNDCTKVTNVYVWGKEYFNTNYKKVWS